MGDSEYTRILVVDDSDTMRRAIGDALRTVKGCMVVAEGVNGLEAVQLTRAHRPGLIVMDIHMPLMGGLEAARLIKSDAPNTRVVLVTSCLDPEVQTHALNLGVAVCLEKNPQMWETLRATVLRLSQSCPAAECDG